ncbi:pyridine nucleotide-disulfide oxidoreductase [Clostridia bacterium]|nr:pyridine nucleotide-disulfide oxidoreductase [Clostridia bacterium]
MDIVRTDVAIIGAGPAGLAAALAANDAGADVLILERDERAGGILNQCIHNGFGLHYFSQELTGPEYAARFCNAVNERAIQIKTGTMALSLGADRSIEAVNETDGYFRVEAGAVVLAMGCRERTRGALAIPGTRPAGVLTAGAAQRLVNIQGCMPGSNVVILGSGDIGLIMARRMTLEGAKVHAVCELMSYSSGLTRNIVQCVQDFDIPLYFNTTVTEIHGRSRVTGVTIAGVDENRRPIKETERFIPCDLLLLSVGLLPENELTKMAGIELDRVTGGAVVDDFRQTNVSGIFACGNVLHVHDLVDNVSHEAEIAGANAARFALGKLAESEFVQVKTGGFARYAVPQRLAKSNDGTADIFFRVGDRLAPAKLIVRSGGREIISRKKSIMTPGEMESVTVKLADIANDIEIIAEKGEA